jgi:hypothetical protein
LGVHVASGCLKRDLEDGACRPAVGGAATSYAKRAMGDVSSFLSCNVSETLARIESLTAIFVVG